MSKNQKESVEDIIKNSGHKLHLRAVSLLEDEGWKVSVSPYYVDDISDKPREIDIIAKKYFCYKSRADNEKKRFYLFLGIDCKFLTQNVVIWGRENEYKANALLTNLESKRDNLVQNSSWSLLSRYTSFSNVGRLVSEGNGSQAFQAGLLQAVKATLDNFGKESAPTIFFPAVVYGLDKEVNVYCVGDAKGGLSKPKPLNDDWIYHIDYAYVQNSKRLQKHFYVDIINEQNLFNFLQKLEEEGKAISETLHLYSVK